ncbi:MAG: RibD family protein, partial [Oscillospiraceae bacterium]
IGTVLADDPMLNCRIEGGHQPTRVIADSRLRIPLDSQICRTARDYPTIVACARPEAEKQRLLEEMGIRVLCLPGEDGHVDLRSLMEWLGGEKLDSVLIEGGGQLHEAALRAGVVNHVCAYIAPKLLGGAGAKSPVEGLGAETPDQAARLQGLQITRLGEDLLLEYDVTGGLNGVHWNC